MVIFKFIFSSQKFSMKASYFIITNPPFHQGKNTDYQFAQNLFKQAKQHLVKDGQLWLIANRHLGYEEWAQEAFDHVEVMVQEKGFKLICAQEPR